ncbi:MAG TPA: hypothetical protein VM510_06895 [Caulifigura sp.]|nr:hypothetical protein [Caulifigura sp.]
MAIFSSTQMSWSEPWFFLLRIRERPSWIKRFVAGLVVSVAMFAAMFFSARHAALGLPQTIGLSLACGFVLILLIDVPNLQRDVTIKDDCIIVGNSFGRGNFVTFDFAHIDAVELLRPEDWNRPWGAMLIDIPGETYLTAVPVKTSLETAADVLHRLGLPVALRGWEPSETDTRVKVQDEVSLPADAVRGVASIRPVEATEPKLTPPSAMAMQVVIGLGPTILALAGLIAAGVYIAMGWKTLPTTTKLLAGGGAFAAFVVSVVWLIKVGQFIANRYGVTVAEKQLRLRSGALFRGDETDLIPIEVFDRSAWTSVLAKTIDFGFLQIDPGRRLLRFEGEKNRWEIPTSALTALKVEQSHVGSEANQNAEKRYYVTLAAEHDGEPWEVGMYRTRTETGADTADHRSARAQALFRQVAEAAQT